MSGERRTVRLKTGSKGGKWNRTLAYARLFGPRLGPAIPLSHICEIDHQRHPSAGHQANMKESDGKRASASSSKRTTAQGESHRLKYPLYRYRCTLVE